MRFNLHRSQHAIAMSFINVVSILNSIEFVSATNLSNGVHVRKACQGGKDKDYKQRANNILARAFLKDSLSFIIARNI